MPPEAQERPSIVLRGAPDGPGHTPGGRRVEREEPSAPTPSSPPRRLPRPRRRHHSAAIRTGPQAVPAVVQRTAPAPSAPDSVRVRRIRLNGLDDATLVTVTEAAATTSRLEISLPTLDAELTALDRLADAVASTAVTQLVILVEP